MASESELETGASSTKRRVGVRWFKGRTSMATGTFVAVVGLVFGGVSTAYAHGSSSDGSSHHHGGSTTTNPIPLPDAAPPAHGDLIPNVTTVEAQIKAYYGSVPGTMPVVGAVTLPSPTGNYAKEMQGIVSRSLSGLKWAIGPLQRHHVKPALIFDIDDTLLNTYDYEIATQFAYTPASNAVFVNAHAFPAVFGMPSLVNWASTHGYTVFFITGRPEAQRTATAGNLADAGYTANADAQHMFLKQATPPAYLHCAAAPKCTTIEFKSGTRAYIESMGYKIVADFGDQFSDLKGGHAGYEVKLPNPMYYLP